MRWSGFRSLLPVILAVAALAGCGTNEVTAPTPPVETTDTFTGTFGPSSYSQQTFIAKAGQVSVKLTSLSHPALKFTLTIGVYSAYYGCGNPVAGSDTASVGTEVIGLATATTALCFTITDTGSVIPIGATEAYTITATHF